MPMAQYHIEMSRYLNLFNSSKYGSIVENIRHNIAVVVFTLLNYLKFDRVF